MNEIKRVPQYTHTQTITFPVAEDGYEIETLCGLRAFVESVVFTYEAGRGDEETTPSRIVLTCVTEYDVEYVHTIRANAEATRVGGTGWNWLDRFTAEAWRIATGEADAW